MVIRRRPEGSDADVQQKTFALVGKELCFDQTLKNTGDVRDSYALRASHKENAASPVFQTLEGQLLTMPLTLARGASRTSRSA